MIGYYQGIRIDTKQDLHPQTLQINLSRTQYNQQLYNRKSTGHEG